MNSSQLAEALRILGVHSNQRSQLAAALQTTQETGVAVTLTELARLSDIDKSKIYRVTEPLRDANILQPQTQKSVTKSTRYVYSEIYLRDAITEKAEADREQTLSVLKETPP